MDYNIGKEKSSNTIKREKKMFGKKTEEMWLIAGLGNPGLQYEKTRHNAGFMALEQLAAKYDISFTKHKFEAVFGDGTIAGKRVLLAKPQTYMNNSGRAVSALAAFYKIPPQRVLVLSDDISLDVGKIRVRRKGSAGGHNGLKDIIELLGTEEFARIKIGVGDRPDTDRDLADWVLGKVPKDEEEAFAAALEKAALAAVEVLRSGVDSAMNRYNG